jgi:hypothetical protein
MPTEFDLIGNLSPVVHPHKWELIRMPVRKVDDEYTLYVGDRYTRKYNERTLPDDLKVKMAMVLSNNFKGVPDHKLHQLMVYTNNQSPELDEIGWRASDTYFCLVVNRETLESLKGGT